MKKLSTAICLLFASVTLMGQTSIDNSVEALSKPLDQMGNNQITLNLLSSLMATPEISYERFVADNMGVGGAVAVSFDKSDLMGYHWAITPFFRLYFGKKKASGFFIEGNTSLVNQRYFSDLDYSADGTSPNTYDKSSTNFGMGLAVGWRFLTRNGFSGDIFIGGGRLLGSFDINQMSGYTRTGISISKRF